MSNFCYSEELNKYEDVDEDELLATLTKEELQELEREMAEIDPDENIPIRLRQQGQTAEQPTGPFSKEVLLKHWQGQILLQETSRSDFAVQQESMDKSQTDKSEKECLGESDTESSPETLHLLKNKEMNRPQNSKPENFTQAKDCNQTSTNSSQPYFSDSSSNGNCRGMPSGTKQVKVDSNLNVMSEGLSMNSTDIDGILEKIQKNDQSMSVVNLNNIENLSQGMLISLAEALRSNTHVQVFSLSNTHADDQVAFALANTIKKNCSITSLNIESNFISGRGILALIRALQQNTSLVELRFQNQRHICGGQVEMEMVKLLRENTSLLKLGYQFDLPGPRMSATSILTQNQDRHRQKRLQLQRQKKAEEAVAQTTQPKRNGPTSIPQNTPDKHPVSVSQEPKCSSVHKTTPRQLNAETYEKTPTKTAQRLKLQEEVTADKQGLNNHNEEVCSLQTTTKKESGEVLKDMKFALKPPSMKTEEVINSHRSVHGDLMAAIRSNCRTLNTASIS